MPVTGHRRERIAEEIQHEVISMLEGELRDPRLAANISVTAVRVSPDLKQARVYVTVEGTAAERDAALAALEQAAGFIRHELVERVPMRRSPELFFVLDESVEQARRIDELLEQLHPAEHDAPAAPSPANDSPAGPSTSALGRRNAKARR
jgi:ribosome-binding factor A